MVTATVFISLRKKTNTLNVINVFTLILLLKLWKDHFCIELTVTTAEVIILSKVNEVNFNGMIIIKFQLYMYLFEFTCLEIN